MKMHIPTSPWHIELTAPVSAIGTFPHGLAEPRPAVTSGWRCGPPLSCRFDGVSHVVAWGEEVLEDSGIQYSRVGGFIGASPPRIADDAEGSSRATRASTLGRQARAS